MSDAGSREPIRLSGLTAGDEVIALTQSAIHLHPEDDVAIATSDLMPRMAIEGPWGVIRVRKLIPSGHKIALRAVALGSLVAQSGARLVLAKLLVTACLLPVNAFFYPRWVFPA